MSYSKAYLARIKMDENKFRVALGWGDINLLEMLEGGFMEIAEVTASGENKYLVTDKGHRYFSDGMRVH